MALVFEPRVLGPAGLDDPSTVLQLGIRSLFSSALLFAATRLEGLSWLRRLFELTGHGYAMRRPRRAFTAGEAKVFMTLVALPLSIAGVVWIAQGIAHYWQ